eukprot:3033281-Amphidinium_carterae.1
MLILVAARLHMCAGLSESFEEKYSDGRTRDNLNRMPGTKKEPHENTKQAESILCIQHAINIERTNFQLR